MLSLEFRCMPVVMGEFHVKSEACMLKDELEVVIYAVLNCSTRIL